MEKLTRRAAFHPIALMGAAVAAPSVALAVAPAPQPDAELFRLAAEFQKAMQVYEREADATDIIEERYFALRPEKPERRQLPCEINEAFKALPVGALHNRGNPTLRAMDEFQRREDERQEAWAAERERLQAELGLPEAEKRRDALLEAANDICDAILATPAATVAGMLLKLRVNEQAGLEPDYALASVRADMERIAGTSA
ncbi:MAG TPA: hypothetical protein VGN97_13425 [Mesorhizobium sp.]|jgi:hypothetical protein|nr:hypothetical protein [Mesorhizobium sp.]